jgi:hypothetical protein
VIPSFRDFRDMDSRRELRDKIEDICHTVRAGMDWTASIKSWTELITGVKFARPHRLASSLQKMVHQHANLSKELRSSKVELPERVSILLTLIQIELVFFGHMW